MPTAGRPYYVVYKVGSALVAQVPDSAITGGNARGTNAVDWQMSRTLATQVASGLNAVISGGTSNTASNNNVTVAGGSSNTASGDRGTVGGGSSNTASATTATVSGGNSNTASGVGASVSGGQGNTAGGVRSWIPGGTNATTRGITGRGAWAGTQINSLGDAEAGEFVLCRQTVDATPTRLTADNAAPSTTNQIILPNFSSCSGQLVVSAKATGTTDAATFRINLSAVRGNGVGTVVVFEGSGAAIVPTASNGTGSAWRLDVSADTTNGGVAVTFTGAAATTITVFGRYMDGEAVTAS